MAKGARSRKVQRKVSRKKAIKEEHAKNTIIENSELLSKEQLKKVAKQPTNNIRVSGKRKRKMLKRLKHAEKDKNRMDVEIESGSAGSSGKKVKKDTDADMNNVVDGSGDEAIEDMET